MTRRGGNRRSTSGQTLILAVIALVVILVAMLVIFDVQNMIRGKIKGQTGIDAAALTGANWQMHSLNLIGELNLVKATTMLTSDALLGIARDAKDITFVPPPEEINGKSDMQAIAERVEREKQQVRDAVALLSQMQTRISFAGPLIGFGAAQQAAKNNGINYNPSAGRLIRKIYDNVQNDDLYGNANLVTPVINGYDWRVPYGNMLLNLMDESEDQAGDGKDSVVRGIAAGTRTSAIGLPKLGTSSDNPSPLLPYLSSRQFYNAVMGNNWCVLMNALDLMAKMDMSGSWWGSFACEYETRFIEESEILPLHIDFFSGIAPYDAADSAGIFTKISEKRSWTDAGIMPLGVFYDGADPYPYSVDDNGKITLKVSFDRNGHPVKNQKDGDLRYNILPLIDWAVFDSTWERYDSETIGTWKKYLQGDFKDGLTYYSGALSYFEMSQQTKTITGKKGAAGSLKGIGADDGGLGTRMKNYADSAKAAESNINTSVHLNATATAKCIGRIKLESGRMLAPFEAGGLILPVFTHTTLIPVALEPVYGFSMFDLDWFYFLTEFIPILGRSSSLQDAWNEAASTDKVKEHLDSFSFYYNALKRIDDPAWRQNGLTWLDTPIQYQYDEHGKMLFDENGAALVAKRRRDTCDYWPSGGGGGGRYGPGILH